MKKPLTICLIDDDTVFQFIMTKVIPSVNPGGKLLQFFTGDEAMAHILVNLGDGENMPDLIFLDIHMPLRDGWQFLDRYLMIGPYVGKRVAIYMISQFFNYLEKERIESLPEVAGYLVKPISAGQLAEVLEKVTKTISG